MATKKVSSAGRFGPRYGKKIRMRVANIEKLYRTPRMCPQCKALKFKRASAGVWVCSGCGLKMAGGAYQPIASGFKYKK